MPRRIDSFMILALVLTGALFVFLLVPLGTVIVQSFNRSSLGLWPPHSLSVKWYREAGGDPLIRQVFMTSVKLALYVGIVSTLFGGMAGYAIGRYSFGARKIAAAILVFPILLPALLLAMGASISLTLAGIPLSFWALFLAQVTIILPFAALIVTVQAASFDAALEDASRDLGASWLYGIRRVVIPNLSGALRAAFIFSFVLSFNEAILSLFLGGMSQTLPAYMYGQFEQLMTPEVDAIGALLVGLAAVALVVEQVAIRRLAVRAR